MTCLHDPEAFDLRRLRKATVATHQIQRAGISPCSRESGSQLQGIRSTQRVYLQQPQRTLSY